MTARRKLLGDWMGRLTKVPVSGPDPDEVVLAEIKALRERVPALTGALVASSDGLLIAHDLPAHIEPNGMAALSASQLSLSYRLATTAHGGGFRRRSWRQAASSVCGSGGSDGPCSALGALLSGVATGPGGER